MSHKSGIARYSGHFAADGQLHYYENLLALYISNVHVQTYEYVNIPEILLLYPVYCIRALWHSFFTPPVQNGSFFLKWPRLLTLSTSQNHARAILIEHVR